MKILDLDTVGPDGQDIHATVIVPVNDTVYTGQGAKGLNRFTVGKEYPELRLLLYTPAYHEAIALFKDVQGQWHTREQYQA